MEMKMGIVGGRKGVLVNSEGFHKAIGVPADHNIRYSRQIESNIYLCLEKNRALIKKGKLWLVDLAKQNSILPINIAEINSLLKQNFTEILIRYIYLTPNGKSINAFLHWSDDSIALPEFLACIGDKNICLNIFISQRKDYDSILGDDDDFSEI